MKLLLPFYNILFFIALLTSASPLSFSQSQDLPPRETINFDFAWKFFLGEEGTIVHCPESTFPHNITSVECRGLKSNSASNADDCRGACCGDIMCAIWQYSNKAGCWIGQSSDCSHKDDTWVGGGRDVPAKPLPPVTNGPTSRDFDDSSWEVIDVPHDGLITGVYNKENGPEKQAYLPKNVTWYRKHFNLPTEWKGRSIWIYFEGVFRASTTYLNGQLLTYHDSGYTSFAVRLDNATNVFYGDGKENENVIAVRAASNGGSGWWYEGGGIYRHTYLVSTNLAHFVPDGLYGVTNITGEIKYHDPNDISKGMYAGTAHFTITAEIVNEESDENKVYFYSVLYDENGKIVGNDTTPPNTMGGGDTITVFTSYFVAKVELWTPARPYLYTFQCQVLDGSVIDEVNVTIGVRQTHWDPNTGFFLNGVHFTWRGFNNHNDFTGVGMAVPDRVNLFRGQSMRAVGANSWRMSHNPPIPVMLDILDRIGVIVWDENREFGNNSIWVQNQKDMVRRDRNHPSVMAWSFCNERGCNYGNDDEKIGNEFKQVSKEEDSYRPVTANQNGDIGGGLSKVIDVQGFSHRNGDVFDSYHKQYPYKPLIGSECCSCVTQRGEDFADKSIPVLGNFNADCLSAQTEYQLNRKFVAGCMVWTLFDYYGEPHPFGWPHVSSSFGSIDLAGFPKASAYWFRSWWLYNAMMNHSTGGNDYPINPPSLVNQDSAPSQDNAKDGYLVHIVEHWEPHPNANTRTIHVYTNAPMAELFINGKSQGVQQLVWQGWAQWSVTFASGNLTATAISDQHVVMATHTILTSGSPAKIIASIDVPSEKTGTGSALVLDGQDTGLVRASIVDSTGQVVPSASHNVSFRIVSGPGRIIGVGNGDPACHEPNHASWRSAYHGLARVVVQVTEDHASSSQHRHRLLQIDRDGGIHTHIRHPGVSSPSKFADSIVVEVSAPGVGSSTVTIPVTTDIVTHNVLNVAKRSMKFNE